MKHKILDNPTIYTAVIGVLLVALLLLIPTGFEGAINYKDSIRAVGIVVATDNSSIHHSGLIQYGEQLCTLQIKDGIFAGEQIEGVNFLNGSLAADKIYQIGDEAFVRISCKPLSDTSDHDGQIING